jgi:UMF1 family MFS transporter
MSFMLNLEKIKEALMAAAQAVGTPDIDSKVYKRRVWAWTMYDWANSAYVTSVLTAVLPIYFSQVAASTLPSAARATATWNLWGSISLLAIGILSPILGTMADLLRGKKRFLAFFVGVGVITTALMVFINTGDWVLASVLVVIGRIGFNGSITFYDALLPHVARPDDQDRVSTRGYAVGYLGGGLLLVINVAMIFFMDFIPAAKLTFLSVAVWWAVFSIPVLKIVPEPPAATFRAAPGTNILSLSFRRLADTFRDVRRYRQLFLFLIAFLIYNDGIGTIIYTATIYGTELGFGSLELILALLMVQFVGIPFSLIFGRLPSGVDRKKPIYLAFILYNLVALPLVGTIAGRALPSDLTGALPAPFASTATHVGEGSYGVDSSALQLTGTWEQFTVSAAVLDADQDASYMRTSEVGAGFDFSYNGQAVEITYSQGNDYGIAQVLVDGTPVLDVDSQEALLIDYYHPTARYDTVQRIEVDSPGEHVLSVVNIAEHHPDSQGNTITLGQLTVLPAPRQSNLAVILGMILLVELVGLGLALLLGRPLFSRLAGKLDTQRVIFLALVVYAAIAIWGFFLNSTLEYWFLAWMVAIVQGGSQALSRSLYASMSPASKSGEFFGLFGILEKVSTFLGPLVFAAAALAFNSSRPGILSLILFFILGGYLLMRVNVAEGKRVAKEEDALAAEQGLIV